MASAPFAASPHARRQLAAIALAALFLSALLTIADAHLLAWDPGHGHIYRDGIPVEHAHAWDWGDRANRADRARPGPGATETVVFTPSAEGMAGASIAVPLLSGQAATVRAAALFLAPTAATGMVAPLPAFAAVPTPPPRG